MHREIAVTAIAVVLPPLPVSSPHAQPATPLSPVEFVSAHTQDAHSVIVAAQEVQAGAGIMANDSDGSDPSALASFDGILSDAQSTFDKLNKVLLDAPKPKGVESSETEMCSATDELSSAMKSARAYVDDQKPSELSGYKPRRDTGRAW
jgi:hypothetical protein